MTPTTSVDTSLADYLQKLRLQAIAGGAGGIVPASAQAKPEAPIQPPGAAPVPQLPPEAQAPPAAPNGQQMGAPIAPPTTRLKLGPGGTTTPVPITPPTPQTAAQTYQDLLRNPPIKEHPGKLRQILAAISGVGMGMLGGPTAGLGMNEMIREGPNRSRARGYAQQLELAKEASDLEAAQKAADVKSQELLAQKAAEEARAQAEASRGRTQESLRKKAEYELSPEGQAFEIQKLQIQHPNLPRERALEGPYVGTMDGKEIEGIFLDKTSGTYYYRDPQLNKLVPLTGDVKLKKEGAEKTPSEFDAYGAAFEKEHGRPMNSVEIMDYHRRALQPQDQSFKNEMQMFRARDMAKKPYQRTFDLATTQLDKINEARSMLTTGTPESQALAVPKVLTAIVSGQGTGVRITQPEMNSILSARGVKGSLEGWISAISGRGRLTPEQRQQLVDVLDDVGKLVQKKQALQSETMDKIDSAENLGELSKAQIEHRKKEIEGSTPTGQVLHGTQKSTGRPVISKDGGKTWQLAQ